MKIRVALIGLILAVFAVSCKKDSVPQQDNFYFSYKVKMSNKITSPTIINGYHGHVLKFEGDFMPSTDGKTNAPDTVRNELYFFETSKLDQLQAAMIEKDGTKFYDLKLLEKKEVKPKFIIIPNKSGFYQIDTNNKEYLVIIKVNKKLGYYNGGALKLNATNGTLRLMNMRIDYKATF
ncbi:MULTISPECIES: hypothetical protein [Roseivirga]|jgi:hypothetical protein|uniref:Lipoprotein n=1 Tax=Roseivirga thermotolerans TaxID=1758176 RepID=A0ABQ3I825_9BACT|nr:MULTISPECIES: hypothetical protein [Roseivirga]MEC7755416.1 hypothetical protein [Bacteroidota bacterium]GHE70954.1 hypothetical protein GCM10011340_28510 [Roseivirga thermotolerans]|tara:strand:+ start:950 stop:1483 length:534 start_codon:yes stop_codon:yes gene_type:complete